MVTTVELDDAFSTRIGSGQPNRAHRGFCSAVHQPDHFDAGYPFDDHFSKTGLTPGRSSERESFPEGRLDGRDYVGIRMTGDQRTPTTYKIDIVVSVLIRNTGS